MQDLVAVHRDSVQECGNPGEPQNEFFVTRAASAASSLAPH
jgi:hypothetical protein